LTIPIISGGQWVPVITARHIFRLRIEEWPSVREKAADILNKPSRTADKGDGPPVRGYGELLRASHRKNYPCYEMDTFSQNTFT
jgi:hypothetical protein